MYTKDLSKCESCISNDCDNVDYYYIYYIYIYFPRLKFEIQLIAIIERISYKWRVQGKYVLTSDSLGIIKHIIEVKSIITAARFQ